MPAIRLPCDVRLILRRWVQAYYLIWSVSLMTSAFPNAPILCEWPPSAQRSSPKYGTDGSGGQSPMDACNAVACSWSRSSNDDSAPGLVFVLRMTSAAAEDAL
jgi:hypothetical protein